MNIFIIYCTSSKCYTNRHQSQLQPESQENVTAHKWRWRTRAQRGHTHTQGFSSLSRAHTKISSSSRAHCQAQSTAGSEFRVEFDRSWISRLLCEWVPFSDRKAPYMLWSIKATTQTWSAHPKIQHFMLLHSTALWPSFCSAWKLPDWTSRTGITSVQPIQQTKLQGALLLKKYWHNCLGTIKNYMSECIFRLYSQCHYFSL